MSNWIPKPHRFIIYLVNKEENNQAILFPPGRVKEPKKTCAVLFYILSKCSNLHFYTLLPKPNENFITNCTWSAITTLLPNSLKIQREKEASIEK